MNYQELIKQMTLEEKCSLLSGKGQFTSKSIERLGIPSITLSDGPHGVRKQAGAADHLGLNESVPATCYPTSATVANSWDEALGEELGKYLGAESKALDVHVLLGPGLNIKRSPLCGRNFEYFSEDPYLAGKMAAAYIRGIQSQGVAACPKHFAANSQELRRMHNDSVLDERTLREIYLTGFEIVVKESKPLSLMTSYNRVNGTYANENQHILKDILAEEWGFDGFVVTDWGGCNNRVAGLVAGNHLEMPPTGGDSDREVEQAVRSGSLPESVLDQRLEEYLRVLFQITGKKASGVFDIDAHHAFAQRVAEDSIVLLKNDDGILPLKEKAKVAVVGNFAETPRYQGAGSSAVNPTRLDKALDSLVENGVEVIGYSTGYKRHGGEAQAEHEAAVELAKKADVVLLYMGLDELLESEGMDREHCKIRQNQVELLDALHTVNQEIVVVLSGGAAIETPWLDKCKALINGYLGGQAGASAMARALVGMVNPSGKLSESWPLRYEDTPNHSYYPGKEKTAEYREGIFVGYRYYDTAEIPVQFPFGYGLSYTTFSYSNINVAQDSVRFTITNTGDAAGAEVAQVYVGKGTSDVFRAKRELKGFIKVLLQPGKSREVTVPLDDKAFRYFNVQTNQFEVEGGLYTVEVGASVSQIRLSADIQVEGTGAPTPYNRDRLQSYYAAKAARIGDDEFTELLGRPIPPAQWDRTKPLEHNDTFSQLYYARGWVGRLVYRVLTHLKTKAEKKGKPDLNILFIYNMPFRGVAKMMGEMVDIAMVDGLLLIFNGHFFKGTGHLIGSFFAKRKAAKKTRQILAQAGQPEGE